MKNLKLFASELAKSGLEFTASKYDETSFYHSISFDCNSLNADEQQPVSLVASFDSHKVHLSLCHGISIILRPYDLKVNWAEMDEDQVKKLASDYSQMFVKLYHRATAFMSDL